MRQVRLAAAQLGPIRKDEPREVVVARMLALMAQAVAQRCDLVVYPELALTTFFPRWHYDERRDADRWFEHEMPNAATRPLFDAARKHGVAMSFGYAELTPEGQHFNTSILVEESGEIVGRYRKIHLPGHSEFDADRSFQHLEKRYFEPGDLGFPVWHALGGVLGMCICNDRRWPETFRVLGLQGAELVMLGFNTPSQNSQRAGETSERRMFHHRLSLQAGAYQNACWVVAVAKAGVEDGHHLMGGTMIVDPDGVVVAELPGERDGLLVHDCDLDATTFGKQTVFGFARHRRPEHYTRITTQTGVTPAGT